MRAIKQTKELLRQVRRELDKETLARVEPILRSILEVAKPKTVTQIEYRHDQKDQAEIDSLRAALLAKEESEWQAAPPLFGGPLRPVLVDDRRQDQ